LTAVEGRIMAHARLKEILWDAKRNHYAVGSFNAWDIQSVKALVHAAEEEMAPVIMSVWRNEIRLAGADNLFAVCQNEIRKASVPVVLFLDHAASQAEIEEAVEHGATSVMIDGSSHPLQENIRMTRAVVETVGPKGVSVEGEVGILGEEDQDDGPEKIHTETDDAVKFVEGTGVDCLAVSIGNAHGFYRAEPKLDFERLHEIVEATAIPIVLHGGSGIPDTDIRRAIRAGITKINVGAEVRQAYFAGMREVFNSIPAERFPTEIYTPAYEKLKEFLRRKIRFFGAQHG